MRGPFYIEYNASGTLAICDADGACLLLAKGIGLNEAQNIQKLIDLANVGASRREAARSRITKSLADWLDRLDDDVLDGVAQQLGAIHQDRKEG
jgi:hypothetical protein